MVKTVPAGQFKAQCLALLDEVGQSRQALVITKRGKPVAKLVPVSSPDVLEELRGSLLEQSDLISPIEESWDAES